MVGSPGGSGSTRRIDPRAELQAATERNAREEREAEELRAAAAKAAQEEEESAKARADAAAKAQAEAAAAATAEGALLATPLRVAAPEVPEPPPEEAGGDLPGLEREDDIIFQEREAAPPSPTGAAQGSRPNAPPAQSAGGEPAVRTDLVVRSPSRQRAGKATSAPDPQKAAGSSSSAQDVEAASASSGWTPGGGTAVVNVAAQDVRNRLQSQAAALRKYNDEFLATRAAIRVSLPIFAFLILVSSVGARQRTHWV